MSSLVSLIHRNGALHALVGIKIRGQRCAIRENASIKRKAQKRSGLQRGWLRKGRPCAGAYDISQGKLPSSVPTTSRRVPNLRSSAATGSCNLSARGNRCCACRERVSWRSRGSGVSSTYSPRLRPLWTSPRHQTGGSRYMRGVVTVSTRALAPAFGLRSSALLAPPQRVQASQLAVKQLNAYVEGVFDRR